MGPPGLFHESALAEAHTLQRAVSEAPSPQVRSWVTVNLLAQPGSQDLLNFLGQISGSSSTMASTLGLCQGNIYDGKNSH